MRFSIIVPTYNSENYITYLLDSLVSQKYEKTDFEVLFVDDCSQDKTVDTIRKYEKILNIKIVVLEENSGGPGKPRNIGIENAKGEYIFFIDSDDFIDSDTLKDADEFLSHNYNDALLLKMGGTNGRGAPQSMFKKTENDVKLWESRIIYTLGPTKIFKRSLLIENEIYFPENIKSAEDQVFTMNAFLNAKKIGVLSEKVYYYIAKREGDHMSNAYVSPRDFYTVMKMIIDNILTSQFDNEKKYMIITIFINRHFNFSRTKNFSLRIKENEKEWMKQLSDFVNKIPKDIDALVESKLKPLLYYARKNDFRSYKMIESSYKSNNYYDLRINENNKLDIKFFEESPYFNNIEFQTPKFQLTDFNFDNSGFSIEIKNIESMLDLQLLNPKLKLISRNKKHRTIIPFKTMDDTIIEFDVKFKSLAKHLINEKIWDVFLEVSIGRKIIDIRIGNNRENYRYNKEDSTIINFNNDYFIFTPYFTKDFDNISFYFKKNKLSDLLKIEYKSNKLLYVKGIEKNLVFEKGFIRITFENFSIYGYLVDYDSVHLIEIVNKKVRKKDLYKLNEINLPNTSYKI